MKKLVAPLLIGVMFGSYAMAEDMDLKAEIKALKKQMAELKAAQEKVNIDALSKQLTEVKAHDAGDNIKFSVDFRTAYDMIDYKLNGMPSQSNGIWTNKLILNMAAQPREDLVFKGALGVYKTFGHNSTLAYNPFQNMDWYATQTPSGDANLRLREAYFLYFGQAGNVPYTVSFGRRPSTDGFLVNYREDNDRPSSPIGHNINMEFDGASFMAKLEDVTGIPGFSAKLCLGRGNSNADAKYPTFDNFMGTLGGSTLLAGASATPYGKSNFDSANMDLAGILATLYDDGQYKAMFTYFKGWNMMGANIVRKSQGSVADNPGDMTTYKDDTFAINLTDVGDLTGGALSVQVSGIGDEINDFLDDTIAFASFAWSKTDPKGRHGTFGAIVMNDAGMIADPTQTEMLGSPKSETGTSYYVGLNMPCPVVEDARFGIEYNHGSKYWRSFSYGEDTLVGSKLSTRGDAYEFYYNLPLLDKFLTAQFRYTYIDYDYTGSDMFFGSTGTPRDVDTTPGAVKSAQNIRLYLRYRY